MIGDEAGAGCLGSSAPDTASETYDDDEAGAGGLGSSAPDIASANSDDNKAGAGCLGSSTPDTASDDEALGWWSWKQCSRCRQWLLGPVFLVAVLQIPPVTLD